MTLQQDNYKDLADLKRELGLAASATTTDTLDAALKQLGAQERRAMQTLKNFPRPSKPEQKI